MGTPSTELPEQLGGAGVLLVGERGDSTRGVDRDRAQKLSQLARCTGIEPAIGTIGQSRDIAKDMLDVSSSRLPET